MNGCGSSPRGGGGGIFGGGGLFGGRGQSQCGPANGGGGGGGCCVPMDCCSTTPAGFGSQVPLDGGFPGQPGGFPGNQPGAAPGGDPNGGDPNGGYPPEIFTPITAAGNGAGAQAAQGAQGAQGAQDAGNASDFEKRLLELVNQVRKQLGLPEVQWDENLAQVARRSAAAKTHTGAPEVLAPYGYNSPEEAMDAWRQSPGHWSIITDPSYTRMGGGWVGDGAAMTFG